MTYNPVVSAIIPVFNRRTLLKEAVDSVVAQTYPRIELIIVDDGSDDGASEDFMQRQDLRFLRLEKTSGKEASDHATAIPKSPGAEGVSAARNAGIKAANGELIALLDSDDLWKPRKIEEQVRYFEKNPEAIICQTEEIWIRRGKRVNPKKIHKKCAGYIFEACLPRCIISPSAVMFRKLLLDEVGYFDESFPVCEDYELWLRVCAKYRVGLISEGLTIKRGGHADQLSNQHSLDYYRIRALVKLLGSSFLDELQRKAATEELKKKCRVYLNGCRKRKNKASHAEILSLMQKLPILELQIQDPIDERANLVSQ